jgi:hypothetical protein
VTKRIVVDLDHPFAFDHFVQMLADEIERERGSVDPERLERLITRRLGEMNLSERELAEFTSRTRMVARAGRSVGEALRRTAGFLRTGAAERFRKGRA